MKVNENKYRTCSIRDWVYNIMYNIIRRNALKLYGTKESLRTKDGEVHLLLEFVKICWKSARKSECKCTC